MQALTFRGKQRISIEHVADPAIQVATDVIVKVEAAGLCGSDLHPYHERERGLDHGTVMGHEVVGVVVEVGRDVRRLKIGQRVAVPFTTSCGRCFYCKLGLTCRCEAGQLFGWVQGGRGLQGLQAEYARVPLAEATTLTIPDDLGIAEAVLLGDVLPTGFFCADAAECGPDGTYAVVGCGPIGLMAIAGARERGAERVYAIDTVPERLALAKTFGALPIDGTQGGAKATIDAATGGRGADGVMECVGSPAAQALAFDLVRPGGVLATVGVHTSPSFSFSPGAAYDKNLTYKVGRCPARAMMERAFEVVRSGKYPVASVVSHTVALKDGARAYDMFDRKLEGCTKVVLRP